MKYRKKPVIIIAKQFITNNEPGDTNMNEIVNWINQGKNWDQEHSWHNGTYIFIDTLEGLMTATCGDYIIRGVDGEFYPCKPEIFAKTYEKVEE